MSHFQLSIKSLEQQVKSISLPRNASVMELKQKIKLVFDVDTLRQRLIFQGKVLKDDKNLLDYENLDDGKVIHLVVRPIHAAHHPENDEPMRQSDSRRMGSRGDRFSFLSTFMNNFQPSLPIITAQNSPFSPSGRSLLSDLFPIRTSTTNRSSYDIFRQGRRPGGLNGLLDIMDGSRPSPITLPIPSSLDMRLSRTLSYIRETRSIMESPLSAHETEAARTISASAIHESRQILQQHPNHASQISFILQELANLYDACTLYLTDVQTSLTQQQQQPQQLAYVLRTARIVQTLSLCHHFLGSILSSMQVDHPSSEAAGPFTHQSSTRLPQPSNHNSSSSSSSNSNSSSINSSSSTSGNNMKRRRDEDDAAGPSSSKR